MQKQDENTNTVSHIRAYMLTELHLNSQKHATLSVWVGLCTRLHSGCSRRAHRGGVVHAQSRWELRLLLQSIVLNEQLLQRLPPLHHVKVIVGTLLVVGGLDAWLDPWCARDPDLLLLVVAPVTIVSAEEGEREREEGRVEGGR